MIRSSRTDSALRPVVTFLNHGVLPFIGREREVERILEFWRETTAEPALRALLVTAEAGMGKSRLAEEIIDRIEREAGAVVHIRFYPDSSLSLAPLLSQAARLATARQQLAASIDGASSIGLLRRLSYLRPTMLILEDIHLLHGTTLRELRDMLNAVGDLPMSLLLLTRPIEIAVRGVIEPWVVSETSLQGLEEPAVSRLLSDLFRISSTDWIAPALHRATLGNPLAIRAALRAAVTSGSLVDGAADSWRITVSQDAFTASLARGVNLLTEGMVAHLTPEERRSAEQLAELGEVFAPRTARSLFSVADDIIETLTFRGILSPLLLPISPLTGTHDGGELLVFSHTLLHRSLMGAGGLDSDRVIAAIAAGDPFFSAHAIDELARNPGQGSSPEVMNAAIARLIADAHTVDTTTDWQLSGSLVDAARALATLLVPDLDADSARELEARIVHSRLLLMRRHVESREYASLIEELLRVTADPDSPVLLGYRLTALRKQQYVRIRAQSLTVEGSWEEMEEFLRDHPDLLSTREYIYYIRDLAEQSVFASSSLVLRLVEQRLGEIEASGKLDADLQRFAHREVRMKLVTHFESREEMEKRLRFLAEIEADPETDPNRIVTQKIMLLEVTGWNDRLKAVLDEWIPRYEALGVWRNTTQFSQIALGLPAAFGEDLETIVDRMRKMIASYPECDREKYYSTAYATLPVVAMLRGEPETALRIAREFSSTLNRIEYVFKLMLELIAEERETIEELLSPEQEEPCATSLLARFHHRIRPPDVSEVIEQTRRDLTRPLLYTRDLLPFHGTLSLIRQISDGGNDAIEKALLPELRSAIEQALRWLEERESFAYMLPIVGRYRGWLTRRQAEAWVAKANRIAQERRARNDRSHERLRITMLDTIEARLPGGEIVPVRGGRLRLLLGLLVADRMLARPLDHREFCRIASGDEDPERARKTMNGAVMRLRDLLGADIINTDEQTPRLDLSRVTVDLLEALDASRQAREAIRGKLLSHALSGIRRALDLWKGSIPFPTLYESMFEAAREDFENEIRSSTLTIVDALVAEDDPVGAEELLRRASTIMPDDTQISDMLIALLETTGRRIEAERIRERMKDEV